MWVFFPLYLVFFSLTPQFCRARKSAFEHRTLSQETRRHGAFSLSLSLFASRFARTKEVSTHRARDRADAVVARLGFARAMAFFPSGVKGSPQNRVGEDARAYLAWDVAMFEDDFPRAM